MQVGALKMDAAVEVFYDLVLNYHPEVLSPQYENFYNAATAEEGKSGKRSAAVNQDRYAELSLHTLSSTLVGLEKQVMSYRRDIADNDYPTEFYAKILHSEEEWLKKQEHFTDQSLKKIGQKCFKNYT